MKLSNVIHATIVHFGMSITTNAEQLAIHCHGLVVDLRETISKT